jgi:hydrogenase maturation protease
MIVDAARLGRPPGTVEILESDAIDISGMSTHNLSLGLFIKYVKQQCDADVFMLAVQPGSREFGAEISEEVAGAIEMVGAAILAMGV